MVALKILYNRGFLMIASHLLSLRKICLKFRYILPISAHNFPIMWGVGKEHTPIYSAIMQEPKPE
ncbi:MAG: hypothetical protein C3F06_01150 [Candidatus Methanoperedenaceae archaeon]|nr:MAG: hypothetical protein C3F06_01150 [Candidatus Methanoperedenaceae archaeon]